MKKLSRKLLVLTMVILTMFSMVACSNGKYELDDKNYIDLQMFGNYEHVTDVAGLTKTVKGKFKIDGDKITFTPSDEKEKEYTAKYEDKKITYLAIFEYKKK